MPSFRTTRRVRHSAENMFALVADIEKYPLFLPLCTGLRIRKRETDAQGRDVLTADMSVGYKAIRESFISRVTLDRAAMEIRVDYLDGPFSRLENIWSFRDLPETNGRGACEVGFFIDYEFRSRMLGLLMGGMFDAAFRRFAEAFERRADMVYARRASVAPPTGDG